VEELDFVLGKFRSPELERKLKAKQSCWDRYHHYIEEEIDVDQVAPIRQYWITDILDLIPAEF